MTPRSNLHTHTTFCDGRSTAEEMVKRAIELSYESIGFSGHAYTPCEPECSMSEEDMPRYAAEVLRLREKYADKIEIYLGVEQDIYSPNPKFHCDYKIGSVHYLPQENGFAPVDDTPEKAAAAVEKYFGGDWYSYAEAYYNSAATAAEITGCDIVGHFDLLTKFNENGACFDEGNPRYRHAAISALEREISVCKLFEINTGAIYRGRRSVPYPAEFILREIRARGGEIVLSSDSHDARGLGFCFDEAAELAKSCGFRYAKILRHGVFENVLL